MPPSDFIYQRHMPLMPFSSALKLFSSGHNTLFRISVGAYAPSDLIDQGHMPLMPHFSSLKNCHLQILLTKFLLYITSFIPSSVEF